MQDLFLKKTDFTEKELLLLRPFFENMEEVEKIDNANLKKRGHPKSKIGKEQYYSDGEYETKLLEEKHEIKKLNGKKPASSFME